MGSWLLRIRLTVAPLADEGDLRLADGITSDDGSAQFGRLEVYSQGGWGTVCGAAGNEADGLQALLSVCCRQLGFSTAVIAAGRVDFLPAEQVCQSVMCIHKTSCCRRRAKLAAGSSSSTFHTRVPNLLLVFLVRILSQL